MDFLRSRWLMLVAGIWIQTTTGSSYVFGLYSESLKQALGYTQTQIDTLGFFKGIGANVGVHTGLLYLVIPSWLILAIGAVHNFFGYFMMWLAGSRIVGHVRFWEMCVFMLVAANAQTYFNTAVVVTSVANFPSSRGTVIGLMKGCLGLSGAILTFFFRTIHDERAKDQVSYTLFVALLPTFVSLLLMFFIRPLPLPPAQNHNHAIENTSLSWIAGITLAIAFFLVPITIINMNFTVRVIFSVILLITLISPLIIALRAHLQTGNATHQPDEEQKLLSESSNTQEENAQKMSGTIQMGQEYSLIQAFTSLEFWLLAFATFCAMGSGLTTFDNVNQLGSSLGYSSRNISVVVSLLSIWNFLGRFGAGAISDVLLRSKGIPRPAFNSITLGLMAIGHFIIATAFPGALYIGTLIIGLCYGSQWSLMPATVSEIFGFRQFGTLFNTIAIASPLGSYVLSVRVAGYIYDMEAAKQGSKCTGAHCFRLAFYILSGVCLLGCLSNLLLIARTRKYYKEVHRKLCSKSKMSNVY